MTAEEDEIAKISGPLIKKWVERDEIADDIRAIGEHLRIYGQIMSSDPSRLEDPAFLAKVIEPSEKYIDISRLKSAVQNMKKIDGEINDLKEKLNNLGFDIVAGRYIRKGDDNHGKRKER